MPASAVHCLRLLSCLTGLAIVSLQTWLGTLRNDHYHTGGNMIPYYFEAALEFARHEWNENKRGIVMASDEGEAWSKVVAEYEKTGGEPVVYVTIFPTIGAAQ